MLEGSKSFAKQVMAAAGIPTARARTCTSEGEAVAALAEFGPPYVVKADGLAGGNRAGQRSHSLDVGQVRRMGDRDRGDAGIARRRVQLADVRIGGERTRQRVLTAAGPQHKDSHGASLPAPGRFGLRAGGAGWPQMSGRSCRIWSRRGPVPTAATGAPMISPTART